MSSLRSHAGRFSAALFISLLAVATVLTWSIGPFGGTQAVAGPKGKIVLSWGVGGVLTEEGTLWQYRPESRHWVTVDQSFALDGQRRKVLPLPVAAGEIAEMEGFGFIVTKSGSAWLYNLDSDLWENLGAPSQGKQGVD